MIRRAFERLAARIPPESLERALAHARLSRLQDQFWNAQRCARRGAVWDGAIAEVGAGEPVRLLEFRVYHGASLRSRFGFPIGQGPRYAESGRTHNLYHSRR